MPNTQKTGYYTLLFVFVLSLSLVGNGIERYHTIPLIFAYISAFACYLLILQKPPSDSSLLYTGIFIRLLMFISLPSLSDDLYRFIWDGTLLKNGIHPFDQLPAYYLDKNIHGINQPLYELLNSPSYFTIYPPLNQFIFWLSAILGNNSWLLSAGIIRLFLFGADIGAFIYLKKLLKYYGKSDSFAFWYLLNPLVILEFTGNLHFEGLVICFLLIGIYHYEQNKKWRSALGFGLSIGTKLLPLVYLPFLLLRGLKEQKKWMISIIAGVIGVLTLLPLVNPSFIKGMSASLDLYFRSFEFNASVYFIARQIGFWIYGYNHISLVGPLLSLTSTVLILCISVLAVNKGLSIPQACLFILTTYLLFTTTVHPWYILPLTALGIISGYWYPIVWSFFIFFTYIGYSRTGFKLPMLIILLEYFALYAVLILELIKKPIFNNHSSTIAS